MSKDNGGGCASLLAALFGLWLLKVIVVNVIWPILLMIGSGISFLYHLFLHYVGYLLIPIGAGLAAAVIWGAAHGVLNYIRSLRQHTHPERPWIKNP